MLICLSFLAVMAGTQPVHAGIEAEPIGSPVKTIVPRRMYSTNIGGATTTTSARTNLKAVIDLTPGTGDAPLAVHFNGTSSTGTIASYHWDFGDGSTAEGATVRHLYTVSGTYTARLVITDDTGASNTASIAVSAEESQKPATQPRAIIGTWKTRGSNPKIVQFDASESKAALPI